ncbi:hypothetical protein CROQUDRAFT_655644 [Cronartium quercuum f. sp. fusiforme G11]|uniref:Mitochondrial 3-ketoacyl-coa thiolase n=1 Tax=Cronartium quercuum f. sp. fusiforme G11 TaxID=708437 RepID=A0A9P6TDK2_9BASI|nr:hypothetical protein CROQUDRAFT_655644 [Cronartium quercuum f. sp. fusiforme G11]
MTPPLPSAFVVAAKRTPFGAFGGSLKSHNAAQLGGIAARAALGDLPVRASPDSVIFGTVLYSDPSSAYLARHVGHHANVPVTTPALTVNRLCGSGFESAIRATQEIALGEASIVLTGGSDNMSLSPYTLAGSSRFGNKYGIDLKLEDSLAHTLVDRFPTLTPMGITAENLAVKYGISRQDCDDYAIQSQQRWAAGKEVGAFADEIVPIELASRKGKTMFEVDEHPRPSVDAAGMARLAPVFKPDGVVTAANASGICDGAAANVIASEAAISRFGLTPLARIVSYNIVGVEPSVMGIGPVEAVRGALAKAGLGIGQIDMFDVNEAFAAQWLAVAKELDLPSERTNIFGGAIALGHPLAASGARILNNLTHNLRRLNKRYAVGAACIGGGQGIAIVLERC